MALVVADRVKQTAASISGTGTYTLSGTFTGFQTFTDGVGDGNTTYYAAIQDANFEIGIGTYTASGATLARTTILQSSNSDNAVSWSSATPTIFTTYPADKAVFKDASGNINGTFVGNITGNVTGNTSGTAATVTGAAQTNITSVGTLSSLTTSGDITVGDDLTINGGQIDLKTNSGAVAKMLFYCESGNAHAQTIQAQPHSASSSSVLTLPVNTGTLVGTGDSGSVSNTMLGGSIANSKLANSSINFGGISLALGASDTTPAFDLTDATNYPTSSLSGTITNAQLAGSIANSKLANDFFNLQRSIMDNPNEYTNLFLTKHTPKVIGTDEAFAIAAKILDITDDIAYPLGFPRVVHMKGSVQNWPWHADKFSDHVGYYLNDKGKLKIGSYQQNDIVHYVEKDKMNLETINVLEEIAWKK